MDPLIQPVADLIGGMFIVLTLAALPILLAGVLMRQLRWFGYDAFEKERPE